MQEPDDKPGAYYVTVVDGRRIGRLLGPFKGPCAHHVALAYVESARRAAEDLDPRAAFYSFGTARWPEDETRPGTLNARFDLPV